MSFSFRKSFKAGPFRTTITHRGITNSVSAGGIRVGPTGASKKSNKSRSKAPETEKTGVIASSLQALIGCVVLVILIAIFW
jgi:hypothetical protein